MDTSYEQVLRNQDRHIKTFGWAVTGVLPTTDAPGAPYAYTVGLTERDHPELLVAGLHPSTGKDLLNMLALRVVYDGEPVTHGQRITDLIVDYDAAVVEGPANDTLWPDTAYDRYGQDRVALAQIVWPCPHHRFPWHDGYCQPRDMQPLLARP